MTRWPLPKTVPLFLTVLVSLSLASCSNAENGASPDPTPGNLDPDLAKVSLPEGFSISYFAPEVPGARSMTQGANGTLFVGTRGSRVYALRDTEGDFTADSVYIIADNLNTPNGVAFRDGDLFVAEVSRVLRFDDIEANLSNPPDPVVVTDRFPTDRSHGWKFIAFGPEGKLYVPVGAPCNICDPDDSVFASITRMNSDGSEFEVYAHGIRNTVGFAWHPQTNALWFTDNGRDMLGDNVPPDELNRATEAGLHFGYPYCHGGDIPDPEFGSGVDCDTFVAPMQRLGPHVAALGMRFYTGAMFPEEYRNQIFIAEHGSWNRSQAIGYRVMLVKLDGSGNAVSYEPFAEGWLEDGGSRWGRPVDVEVLPDGSLLVSDDAKGCVYRIRYGG